MPTAVRAAAREVLLVAVEERWDTAFMDGSQDGISNQGVTVTNG
jgi:hypothetical protein